MNTYTITNRPTLLQRGDTVVFTVKGETQKYAVSWAHLDNYEMFHNQQVFEDLDLDARAFALSAYGYEAPNGIWPSSKYEDYPALTRLVNALYRLIAELEPHQITEAQSKQEAKLRPRVGDRVRFISGTSIEDPALDGQMGTIIKDDTTTAPFLVRLDSGREAWRTEARLEVIPESTMTPEQHLDAYLSAFTSERFRINAKSILGMLKTLA